MKNISNYQSANKQHYSPSVDKLTLKEVSMIVGCVAPITISRLARSDINFPKIVKRGRSSYINCAALYKWLSMKAECSVSPPDVAIKSKEIQILLSRSHTWVWSAVQSGVLPALFKINRSTFWIKSHIDALLNDGVDQ